MKKLQEMTMKKDLFSLMKLTLSKNHKKLKAVAVIASLGFS